MAKDICLSSIDIWFQDEARVGQQGTLSRVWAIKGSRPRLKRQLQYNYSYIFGAICPQHKRAVGLVLPFGSQLFKKFTPTGKEANKMVAWIEGKIAEKSGLTPQELIKFRKIANTQQVKKLTDEINVWSNNFYSKQAKVIDKVNTLNIEYNATRKLLNDLNKSLIEKVKWRKYDPLKAKEIRRGSAKQISE